jgi:hypothetical protein
MNQASSALVSEASFSEAYLPFEAEAGFALVF